MNYENLPQQPASIAFRLVLAEKSELSLNEKDVFRQTFHRGISKKTRSFILCEKKPAQA